jgi:hypothetical protein
MAVFGRLTLPGNGDGATMRMRVPVASLAESLGFAAIEVGKIAEGGRLIHARAPLGFQNLIKYPIWKVTRRRPLTDRSSSTAAKPIRESKEILLVSNLLFL